MADYEIFKSLLGNFQNSEGIENSFKKRFLSKVNLRFEKEVLEHDHEENKIDKTGNN